MRIPAHGRAPVVPPRGPPAPVRVDGPESLPRSHTPVSSSAASHWTARVAEHLPHPAVMAAIVGATFALPVVAPEALADTHDTVRDALDARSPEERELAAKLEAYVKDHFGGDYNAAFTHFDADGSQHIERSELLSALKKIGVGNALTRGAWADRVMAKLDVSPQDGKLSWAELTKLVRP